MGTNSAINLGLPASPLATDSALYGELIPVYNAIRILQQVLDDVGIFSSGGAYDLFPGLEDTATTVALKLIGGAANYITITNDANDPTIGTSAGRILYNANEVGWREIPQNSQSAAYVTVLSDNGKHILHPTSDNNARTFTIDSNANVAYPIGATITFYNQINTVTIAITSDTLTLAGTGATGSRTLAAYGIATVMKVGSTSWVINGTGLT